MDDFPVVDLASGDATDAINRACSDLGFFAIVNHGVPGQLTGAALDQARRFFALTAEEKMTVAFPEPGYPYGYAPYRYETLAASLDDSSETISADLKESFSVGPDCLGPRDHEPLDPDERWIRSPSLWPTQLPELQPTWEATFQALADLSARLLRHMAEALALPADYFDALIDHHTSAMRALHYPPHDPGDDSDDALRASAHTDYGTLTVLATDGKPGLEVLDPRVGWRPVPHVAGGLVVNLGDSIAQWTNDRWRSTLHRVVSPEPGTGARYSLPFFHMANWDATIECLPTCVGNGESPRHQPVQAGPWLMRKFQATGPDDDLALPDNPRSGAKP